MIKNLLKKLFCKHDYKYERSFIETYKETDFGGSGYNTWDGTYDIYKCIKYGKTKKVQNGLQNF